ncbi:MAG: dTMP kinase, partial [Calditrichia bacterium]
AYQGYGRNLDLSFVNMLNRFATSGLKPFRTFFIDISPKEAEKRRKAARADTDRMESEDIDFYRKIRRGFLELTKQEPGRVIRIDGERNPAIIADEIWDYIRAIWNL